MADNTLKLSPYSVDGLQTPGFDYNRFQDKLDKLPADLLDLILDPSIPDFIINLTQKHIQLSVQGPDIARLIRDVIIGDIFIGDMPKELSNRLGVDQTFAREIANQIVAELFRPVLEDIKRIQSEHYPGRLPQKREQATIPSNPPKAVPQGDNLTGQARPDLKIQPSAPTKPEYPGEELPESGGNIIDLRNKS